MKWTPTQKQYSKYEEIVKKYQKLRSKIIKAHKNLERVTSTGRMPAMVVPKRVRKQTLRQIRLSGRMMFNAMVKQLKKVVDAGLKGFYSDYKKSYMQLYSEYLIEEAPMGANSFGFFYTKEQISLADEKTQELMHLYNKIKTMNPFVFGFLMKSGRLPAFNKLYVETQQQGQFEVSESFLAQFKKGIYSARYMTPKATSRMLAGGKVGEKYRNIAQIGTKSAVSHRVKKLKK